MLHNLETYLKEHLDDEIEIREYEEKNMLPLFYRDIYEMYRVDIVGFPCLILKMKKGAFSVKYLIKHLDKLEDLTGLRPVLFFNALSSYRIKALIKHHIPFLIENGQMFLPFLGLHLKQTRKAETHSGRKVFAISTQVVFLYFLYNPVTLNTHEVAKTLNMTEMTASRALNELNDLNLVTYTLGGRTNRSKYYTRIGDPEYFSRGKTYLKSPIFKKVCIEVPMSGALLSASSALGKLTMLSPPEIKVLAVDKKNFNKEKYTIIADCGDASEDKTYVVELWHYDPKIFSNETHADKASLYAIMKEDADERIEQALDSLLRDEPWYTD